MEKTYEIRNNVLHLYSKDAIRIWQKPMVLFTHAFIYCKDVVFNTDESMVKTGELHVDNVVLHNVEAQDLMEGDLTKWLNHDHGIELDIKVTKLQ